ncbi:MAG TPA: amidohydrolase family protein, partial [Cyclobacteriaceae bacterium]|nr:amidohydrolase family protein [Cyclobacteriaceae bacterium]
MKYLFSLALVVCLLSCSEKKQTADLIIKGGKIYTGNEAQPEVEAVAVKGEKIIFAGKESEANELKSDQTKMIDLQGKTMTPGFIEGHGHLLGLGFQEITLNLADAKSYDEVVERVKNAVAKVKPGDWIIGRGWHQDRWEIKPKKLVKGFQTHEMLSAVSPNNPVYLTHASGHAAFANAKAMEIAGVNQLSKEQLQKNLGEGGEIIRDPLGNPTGIFVEHAQNLVARVRPQPSVETVTRAYEMAM